MVARIFFPLRGNNVKATLLILLNLISYFLSAQEDPYKYFYRIYFKDKGENEVSDFTPSELFTQRAIDRREKNGIQGLDFNDLPVYSEYLDIISSMGLKLHCTSRWMNTAVFKTENQFDINIILNLSFVTKVKIVKSSQIKSIGIDKLHVKISQEDFPSYDNPIQMLNGQKVHNSGFKGEGILIAVLDGGFYNADNISSLDLIRKRNGIKGTYDFVRNDENVYDFHNHGTAVLSVLAGCIPGSIAGTAPEADYWLLRTEDTGSEFPVEEDYWASGAEFADSIGADIISSSLGYFIFDDPVLNYKYSDMDGNTTFVTQAADIAASRGILVVSSAGNERNDSWLYLISPSDGDSVLAVGAVDWTWMISSFSSAGPSYDRRIKPDVVAQGVSVPVQVEISEIQKSSGTSFSCPVISGMCACVLQAVPNAKNYDIISSLQSSSDRYFSPDSLYGYGIPDISETITRLQELYLLNPEQGTILYPNPFENEFCITFREIPQKLRIEIYDIKGSIIKIINFSDYISRYIQINNLNKYPNGIYFIRITTDTGNFIHKAIRYNRP